MGATDQLTKGCLTGEQKQRGLVTQIQAKILRGMLEHRDSWISVTGVRKVLNGQVHSMNDVL